MTYEQVRKDILSKLTVPVPVASVALGISRNSGYEGAKRGEIPVIEVGNRKNVPTSWLREKLGIKPEAA